MIDLYSWKTSNGRKATIMVEELGIDYTLHPINIGQGDQFTPEYTAINPNQRIPAMVDHDGPGGTSYTIIESGAMLLYLADKYGKFIPQDTRCRYDVIQWLMFQIGNVGPIFGQTHHFLRAAKENVPYAIERYTKETRRLWGVLNQRLSTRDYLVGDYSIADIATFPWTARHEWQQIELDEFPHVKRWFEAIYSRPAVQKGMELPASN
jgi:GST-like protein